MSLYLVLKLKMLVNLSQSLTGKLQNTQVGGIGLSHLKREMVYYLNMELLLLKYLLLLQMSKIKSSVVK